MSHSQGREQQYSLLIQWDSAVIIQKSIHFYNSL